MILAARLAAYCTAGVREYFEVLYYAIYSCCSDLCYYNTGNYATIEDRKTNDKQINYAVNNYFSCYFCVVLRMCGGETRKS